MKIYKVTHENRYYRIFFAPDVEYSNPLEYFKTGFIEYTASMDRDILLLKNLPISIQEIENFVIKETQERWVLSYYRNSLKKI